MKILLLLRHAKSSWKDDGLPDQARPLAKRGVRDASAIGRVLAKQNMLPDLILSSTAKRTRQTVDLVADASGYYGEVRWLDELYAAPSEAYIDALCTLPDEFVCVMVVGHNPGLEELLTQLTGEEELMPTAALAQVDLSIDTWSQLGDDSQGRMVNIWRPREL